MRSAISHSRLRLAATSGVATICAALLAVGMSGGTSTAATAASHARPAASADRTSAAAARHVVQPLVQEFGTTTTPFCPAHSGNAPCDGAPNDYGTIDRVPSGFSDGGYGNYAPGTAALTGDWMAIVSGTGDGNQGAGCPGTTATSNPGEACTGPYALFGTGKARGKENVFPTKGFTVTDDLYLSPSTGGPAGSLVDDDVEINNNAGAYGIDNIITACAEDTASATLGYVINFGHNSAGSCEGTPVITQAGWYRFVFVFSDTDGYAYLTESVRSEATGRQIATSGPQPVGGRSPERITRWGGPGYFWLPTEDYSGLPLANFALQLGQVSRGHRP
ncbi:MAG TPA: hypothetical protein VMA32_13635 [Streptosporangiaceae bacterium]|nr:hypothetical protein [Streptosporangiaceae bacterium]